MTLGCKCSHSASNAPAAARASVASNVVVVPEPPPVAIESAFAALNRARKFSEASRLLAGLSAEKAAQPEYRFVNAYLAVRTGEGARALSLLDGLAERFGELKPDILRLRAEAQLQTADALVGAAWLDEVGRSDAWLEAGRQLYRLGQSASALQAIEKGLVRAKSRTLPRGTTLQAELRTLRLEIQTGQSDASPNMEDLSWLATESPAHAASRQAVARALDAATLKLEPKQQVQRLRRLADAGWVERVDVELAKLPEAARRLLAPGSQKYLRGRARQVARREQIEGAKLLESAADLLSDDATQRRIDAARLYVREGELSQALRVYDRVAQLDRNRSEEAQFYAARAAAILGEPRRGIERYNRYIERYPRGRWRALAEQELALTWLALGDAKQAEPQLLRLAEDAARRDERPSLLELAGVSALLLGHQDLAAERWRSVVKSHPLSLAGAFAAARLQEMPGLSASPRPDAVAPVSGETFDLSRRTAQLLAFGIDDLAADAYANDRSQKAGRNVANGCSGWAKIGYGERGFALSGAIRGAVDLGEPPNAESRWMWDCRFPRPYAGIVAEFEALYRLPPYLLHAVMRQESGFDPAILSPVGAVGLMQLMPQTASRLAEELGLTSEPNLFDPRTNLQLGAAYLRKLLDVFAQNLVLAVAAYNAGPKAVALWQRHAGTGSVEVFAARIPYAETQKYVERVLSNLLVYRFLHGQNRDFEGLSLALPKELKDSADLY